MNTPSVQKGPTKNRWFFVGRSIGVTLLGLYALESSRTSSGRSFLVFTHRSGLYKEIVAMYPHIEIVFLHRDNTLPILRLLIETMFQQNTFLYPPSFGAPPLLVRWFSYLLCWFRTDSRVIGYVLEQQKSDRFFYSKVLPVDLDKNIFTAVSSMTEGDGEQAHTPPSLLFSYDASLVAKLPKKYLVFHPFAAGEVRTYPDSLSVKLLNYLLETYPDHTVIISGSLADEERAKKIQAQLTAHPSRVQFIEDLVPKSFGQTVQLVSMADLYIGVDTGITHVAAHLGTPTIVLANRSNPMWLPEYSHSTTVLYNLEHCSCTPDKKGDCRIEVDGMLYFRCMVEIPWQSIRSAIELRIHG